MSNTNRQYNDDNVCCETQALLRSIAKPIRELGKKAYSVSYVYHCTHCGFASINEPQNSKCAKLLPVCEQCHEEHLHIIFFG